MEHPLFGWLAWVTSHAGWFLGAMGLMGALGLVLKLRQSRVPVTDSTSWGSARFATADEVHQARVFQGGGVVAGLVDGQVLRLDDEEDVLVVGPKGVGKTAAVMVPTLKTCCKSVICLDMKGSLRTLTAAARQGSGWGPVYVLDPLNPRGDRLNPLDWMRWQTPFATADAQRMADHLVSTDGATSASSEALYYRDNARLVLTAGLLYVGYAPGETASLPGLLRLLSRGPSILAPWRQFPQEAVRTIASYLGTIPPPDRGAIWTAAQRYLMPWLDPVLAAVSADTTIDLEAFQQADVPCTLYLVISVEDVQGRLRAYTRLVLDFLNMRLCDRLPTDYRQEVLWCIDDAAELGHVPMLGQVAAHRREYGHRLLLTLQAFAQVRETASLRASALLENCTTWVLFRPASAASAQLIAQELGEQTVADPVDRVTRQGWGRVSTTSGRQTHRRWLLTPDELKCLGADEVLICAAGMRPVRARQLRYYQRSEAFWHKMAGVA